MAPNNFVDLNRSARVVFSPGSELHMSQPIMAWTSKSGYTPTHAVQEMSADIKGACKALRSGLYHIIAGKGEEHGIRHILEGVKLLDPWCFLASKDKDKNEIKKDAMRTIQAHKELDDLINDYRGSLKRSSPAGLNTPVEKRMRMLFSSDSYPLDEKLRTLAENPS